MKEIIIWCRKLAFNVAVLKTFCNSMHGINTYYRSPLNVRNITLYILKKILELTKTCTNRTNT